MRVRLVHNFKIIFLRGLAVMLPLMLTLMIIVYVFQFIQNNVGRHFDTAAQWLVIQCWGIFYEAEPWTFSGQPGQWERVRAFWAGHQLAFIGILLTFLLIYFVGRFVASIFGRAVVRLLDATFRRLPLLRHLYPQVKQVTDYFFSDNHLEFSRVVAVEYPRRGVWSLGLVTAGGLRKLGDTLQCDLLTIFIPSSPTPVTGYTITVNKDDVIDLPLTIDEAFRFTISGGVIQPPGQMVGQLGTSEEASGADLPAPAREERQP